MTEVLSISSSPDGTSHFGSSSLRRSSSQTSFLLQTPTSYSRSSTNLKSRCTSAGCDTRLPTSLPSSAPSSPRFTQPEFSNQPSYTSTPSSSLSLDEECSVEEEDIIFPSYGDRGYENNQDGPAFHSSPVPTILHAVTRSASDSSLATSANPAVSELAPTAGDDMAIRREPTRHVDYLSHNWKEEDIWSSWRHIVARRKVYSNSPRLENASWRTWTKSKYRLKTVSPEALNWLKDHDVTWLYGPLQTGTAKHFDSDSAPPVSQLSRSNSFGSKKPILKKRSLSEIMLQRSLSSSTLMKQATDSLRAQQPEKRIPDRPILGNRALSDFVTSSNPVTPGKPSFPPTTLSSSTTSGRDSPCTKRHIHFNDKVEQCIAINKGGDDHEDYYSTIHDESSSDDDLLTMKPVFSAKAKISNRSTPRNSFSSESKTIAMLPSTTLNYRGDTPEPAEQRQKQHGGFWNFGSKLPQSPSQETLKPSAPSINFLLDDEDEDADLTWQPSSSAGRRNSTYPIRFLASDEAEDSGKGGESSGLRRTPSGMFMPYEDDDDQMAGAGIFGKVVDTVNTAKDIAHVIWNVGWRK